MDGHQTQGPAPSHRRNTGGFLLVEAIFAVAVFSIGVLAVVALQTAATKRAGENLRDSQAQSCLEEEVERLKALDFTDDDLYPRVLLFNYCVVDNTPYTIRWVVFDNDTTLSIRELFPDSIYPQVYGWDKMFGDPANPRVDIDKVPTNIPVNTKVIMVYSELYGGNDRVRQPVVTVNTRL
jgi:type II secretory pathway pseudopilin PulG